MCGKMLLNKEETWYGLCSKCRMKLVGESDNTAINRCDLCGRPLISESGRCLPCREMAETELPAYDRIISLFPYTGKYQKLLEAFKFRKSLGTGNFIAEQLTGSLKLLPLSENKMPVFVPVPPRPGKIRKSGWDQIAALSKLLKRIIGDNPEHKLPKIKPCLVRKKSQTQKSLDRKDRRKNLKGRIIARGKVPEECILFDDVITTGSTMNACAMALKQAGAAKVYGICLFYD